MMTTDMSNCEKKQRMHAFGGFGRTHRPFVTYILPKIGRFTRWFTRFNPKRTLLVTTMPKKSPYYMRLQSFFIVLTQFLGQFFLCKCTIVLKPAFSAVKTGFCTSFQYPADFFMQIHHICDLFDTLKDSWRLQKAVHELLKLLNNIFQGFDLPHLKPANAANGDLQKVMISIKPTPQALDFRLLSAPILLSKGA